MRGLTLGTLYVLLIVSVACGNWDSLPTSTPQPTTTPRPTVTPQPTATPQPTSTPLVEIAACQLAVADWLYSVAAWHGADPDDFFEPESKLRRRMWSEHAYKPGPYATLGKALEDWMAESPDANRLIMRAELACGSHLSDADLRKRLAATQDLLAEKD